MKFLLKDVQNSLPNPNVHLKAMSKKNTSYNIGIEY